MLAAAINRDHPGSGWTADIASKKYLYLQGKYSAAKTASFRSDWGLSQAELTKGTTMDQKLDGMCKEFCAWDKWFGSTQKYNPSNVQDSSQDHITSYGGAAAQEREATSDEDLASEGDDSEASDDQGGDVFTQQASEDQGEGVITQPLLDSQDSTERANAFMHNGALPPVVPPVPAPATPLPLSKPPTQAQMRKDKASQKADELEKTKVKIMEAISANSTSVNNSPRGTFDATYVATTNAKIEGSIRVESMRANSQKAIASDELKLSTMKLQFQIESAESDRASRGSIQTEINITSLLNTDPSGKTARLMIQLVAERAAASAAPVANASLSNNVAAFQLALALPAVAVVAMLPVAARAPSLEVIVLNSNSNSAQPSV